MGSPTKGSDSLVVETERGASGIQSIIGHVESDENAGGPPSKPKYYLMTDREQYCEGTVKRTPGGE